MTLSYLGQDSGTTAASPPITVNFTTTLQPGDIVIVIGGSGLARSPGIGSTPGYTDILPVYTPVAFGHTLWAAYKIMGSTPDTSVNLAAAGSPVGVGYLIFYFRGADPTTQPDVSTTTATATGSPDSPSITTATDGAIVMALASSIKDTSITGPSGYSNHLQVDTGGTTTTTVAAAWKLVSSAGAEDPAAWTGWSSAAYAAATIAIRPGPDLSAALGGEGALSSVGLVAAAASTALAGSGSLDSAAFILARAAAAIAGEGALAAVGILVGQGDQLGFAAIAGIGTLASSALLLAQASVALDGAGTLASDATHTPDGAAALAGDGTLGLAETMIAQATVSMASAGLLEFVTPDLFRPAASTLAGVGALAAFGIIVVPNGGVVAFAGSGAMVVTATRLRAAGLAALAGEGAVVATALQKMQARATLQGVGMLTFNETLVPSTMTIRRASGTPAAIVDRQSGGSSSGPTDRRPGGAAGAVVDRRP